MAFRTNWCVVFLLCAKCCSSQEKKVNQRHGDASQPAHDSVLVREDIKTLQPQNTIARDDSAAMLPHKSSLGRELFQHTDVKGSSATGRSASKAGQREIRPLEQIFLDLDRRRTERSFADLGLDLALRDDDAMDFDDLAGDTSADVLLSASRGSSGRDSNAGKHAAADGEKKRKQRKRRKGRKSAEQAGDSREGENNEGKGGGASGGSGGGGGEPSGSGAQSGATAEPATSSISGKEDDLLEDPYYPEPPSLDDVLFTNSSTERSSQFNFTWPRASLASEIDGQITLGALHMVHERSEDNVCGKIMPQGGIQALEIMLFSLDYVNGEGVHAEKGERVMPPGVRLGVLAKDDCDRDIFGLEQAVDFIKDENDADMLCEEMNFSEMDCPAMVPRAGPCTI